MTSSTLDRFDDLGIAALVRAGERKEWFFGHMGACLIAGARLLRNPELPGAAALALSEKLQHLTEQHQEWFTPLDATDADAAELDPLLRALRDGAGTLRTTGHSTIYTTTALSVLTRMPAKVTRRVVQGLVALHDTGREDDPARYYGHADYFDVIENEPAEGVETPHDSLDALRGAVAAADHLVPDQSIAGRHYFLAGEKIHLFTHAHAIATLEALGHGEIAQAACLAQGSLVRLIAASHALPASTAEPTTTTPFDASFWRQDTHDPFHVIKLAEAVVAQLPRLRPEERDVATGRLGGLWALLGIR